jgi:heme exporter protein B
MADEVKAGKQTNDQTSFFKSMWAIVWKDFSAEIRSRELISAMLVFSLLVIIIFYFALQLRGSEREAATPGILWVTFVFAGTLGFNRSMAVEKDLGCLDGLLLAPVDRSAIYFGKVIGNLFFMFIMEVIVLFFFAIFYDNFGVFNLGLLITIVLGSIGYSVVGTLLSSMTVYARTRDILLPILLFPIALPVLISAVRASGYFLEGLGMEYIWSSINLLITFDLIYIGLAYMMYDYIVQE